MVFGHDHGFSLQQASNHRFGGSWKEGQIQSKSGFSSGGNQLAERNAGLDHRDAVFKIKRRSTMTAPPTLGTVSPLK
jgi:hypothetical protein